MEEVFRFGELKSGARRNRGDWGEVVYESRFFEAFRVDNLPSVKGMVDVVIVEVDGYATFNFFLEGIILNIFEVRWGEAGEVRCETGKGGKKVEFNSSSDSLESDGVCAGEPPFYGGVD